MAICKEVVDVALGLAGFELVGLREDVVAEGVGAIKNAEVTRNSKCDDA